jgi:hypothetical protein
MASAKKESMVSDDRTNGMASNTLVARDFLLPAIADASARGYEMIKERLTRRVSQGLDHG